MLRVTIKHKFFILFIILLFAGYIVSCKDKATDPPAPDNGSTYSGVKLAPDDGECLFILGQASETHMQAYLDEVRSEPVPAGFAFYTSLSGDAVQQDLPRYKTFMDAYPNTILQLAIWTGERQWGNPGYYLDQIVNGDMDSNIGALATACKTFGKPIFIRFGYEFDGAHNAYPPDKYVLAYRYFVDKMRSFGVDNVAYVWHSWGVEPYYGKDDFPTYYLPLTDGKTVNQELWYPGDDYVDWVGLSIFGIGWGDLKTNAVVQYLLDFARTHEKAVMLAEAAAIKGWGNPDPNWVIPNTDWLQQAFALCNDNDVVKAFTYINVDWTGDNPASNWGDTRIQSASIIVRNYWQTQIAPFLHASDSLYTQIHFE